MDYEVLVQLKGEVLDTEGRAITEALKAQGIAGVQDVLVSKRYVVSVAPDQPNAESIVKAVAEGYLANPVAQTYKIKRLG